jgi:hypothetical protein
MHEQTLGEMLMLNLRDYSAVGLGLCHHAPLNIGQELLLKLGRGAASVSVVCTVVVCREIGESLYQIGAEFTRLLGDIALDEPVRLNWIKPSSFPIARGAAAA